MLHDQNKNNSRTTEEKETRVIKIVKVAIYLKNQQYVFTTVAEK